MNMPYRSITGNLPTDYYKAKGSAYINQRVSQAPRDQNHEMLRNFHDSTIRTTQSAGANEGERYQRADVTRLPTRRFPTRTARTLPLTTPPSVRGVAAINQLPNQQLTKRFVHSN
uniref:Uncharacterized protein n=1 Tax=Heterorhabditis bacteriophora TaxID=37862 RepID=A0A1I7XUM5_HETBA